VSESRVEVIGSVYYIPCNIIYTTNTSTRDSLTPYLCCIPVAATTVCKIIPDDGRKLYPKHVEL